MKRPTVDDLDRRVQSLERGAGPLTAGEALELEALEAAYASAFPRPIDQMTTGELEDLIRYHGSVAAGRYDELKRRVRTAEEIRRSKERAALIDAMSAAELNAYLGNLACLRPSEIGR